MLVRAHVVQVTIATDLINSIQQDQIGFEMKQDQVGLSQVEVVKNRKQ